MLNWTASSSVEYFHIHADSIGYHFYCGPHRNQVVIDIPQRAARLMQSKGLTALVFNIKAVGPGGSAIYDPWKIDNIQL